MQNISSIFSRSKKLIGRRRNPNRRRGAATVEFALVSPLFILLLFGMIEFGRMTMVKQVIINASREGARQAVVEGATSEKIKDVVETYLTASHVPIDRDDIEISADPATVNSGDPITVRVWVPYEEVSWLPGAMYLGDSRLTASSVMRKEGIQ
jgi:Flp pilus assembly protein TadG